MGGQESRKVGVGQSGCGTREAVSVEVFGCQFQGKIQGCEKKKADVVHRGGQTTVAAALRSLGEVRNSEFEFERV